MKELSPSLPRIEQLGASEAETSLAVANTLKNAPALRVLGEMVRTDPEMFEDVAAYTARREEFRADYDVAGRNVAPWFAGAVRSNPDLVDTALTEHFRLASEATKAQLREDAGRYGFSYWPISIIGTGPQAQIFCSALLQEAPDLAKQTLLVDQEDSPGGTFRTADGMNFRLNSRSRPQTDAEPTPGTPANLNTLAPGIVSLSDLATETYPGADELGRTRTPTGLMSAARPS